MAIVVGSRQAVIANGNAGGLIEGGQTLQIGQDIGLALGGGHVGQGVASGVLKHAFGGTYCEHGFADVGGGHTVAHFDAERFGELSVTYRAFGRVGQGKGDGEHHVTWRREESVGRLAGTGVHAGLQCGVSIAESKIGWREVARGFGVSIPDFHRFDRSGDFLPVGANVLHHGSADCAGNAGQSLDALEPELYGEGHEIIPIGTGLGIDMHGAILALYRCSLVRHSDEASGVSNHHAVERLIGNKQVGAATDDDQRQAFGIGILHGFDEPHARGRLDEMGDGSAHAHGGDVCKACHGFLS